MIIVGISITGQRSGTATLTTVMQMIEPSIPRWQDDSVTPRCETMNTPILGIGFRWTCSLTDIGCDVCYQTVQDCRNNGVVYAPSQRLISSVYITNLISSVYHPKLNRSSTFFITGRGRYTRGFKVIVNFRRRSPPITSAFEEAQRTIPQILGCSGTRSRPNNGVKSGVMCFNGSLLFRQVVALTMFKDKTAFCTKPPNLLVLVK